MFRGRPLLINGFNTFLPPGYYIEAPSNPLDPVKVITPADTKPVQAPPQSQYYAVQSTQQPKQTPGPGIPQPAVSAPTTLAPPLPTSFKEDKRTSADSPMEFNNAISFVNKVKNRFASEPEVYKQFLEVLQMYQKDSKPIFDIYQAISALFKDSVDLLEDFRQFLPDHLSSSLPKGPVHSGSHGGLLHISTIKLINIKQCRLHLEALVVLLGIPVY